VALAHYGTSRRLRRQALLRQEKVPPLAETGRVLVLRCADHRLSGMMLRLVVALALLGQVRPLRLLELVQTAEINHWNRSLRVYCLL
jgi:hypothetical protein